MKKLLLSAMLLCVLLSIIIMLSPSAYIVASCEPPPFGEDWKIPYSYFDTGLAGEFFWFDDVLVLGVNIVALVCISFFVVQLIFKKMKIISFIFLGVGLFTSVLSLPTSTADGYPNSFPFISAVAALCVVGLLLFHFFSGKLAKIICFVISVGAVASAFSLFMSHLITIQGVAITSLLFLTIALYFIFTRHSKPLNRASSDLLDMVVTDNPATEDK